MAHNRMIGNRWVTIVGHFTPLQHLEALAEIVRMKKAKHVVEVGSWVGESAIAMQQAGAQVTCIDHFRGTLSDRTAEITDGAGGSFVVEHYFRKNVGELLGKEIFIHKMTSLEAADALPYQNADLIFLDAGHEYDDVKDDIEAWTPHLAKDGWLCGHDFTPEFPGVAQAVTELLDRVFVYKGTTVWVCKEPVWTAQTA